MSTHSTTHGEASDNRGVRTLIRTYNNVQSIAETVSEEIQNKHASIVYNNRFWASLQHRLFKYIDKRRVVLMERGYNELAMELESYKSITVRTAIEEFRHSVKDSPRDIHTEDPWNDFIRSLEPQNNPERV